MTSAANLLTQIDDYADLIDEAIEEKDWDRLNELLVDRHNTLEVLLALDVSDAEKASIIIAMTTMHANDQQMLTEVQRQKDALQKQLSAFVSDRKSVQAYISE